jgi:hypothetical protein
VEKQVAVTLRCAVHLKDVHLMTAFHEARDAALDVGMSFVLT